MKSMRDPSDARAPTPSPVGRLLRHWRSVRRMSQLDLAGEAGVSARHVSFVETGRSTPSRAMVLRLARALDVPLRERNALLEAAGYAALYRESDLSEPQMELVRRAVAFLLERHEPYSAVAIDRLWNVRAANRAHDTMLGLLLDGREISPETRSNLLRLAFDPGALRPAIVNWEEVARALVDRLHRETAGRSDADSEAFLEEILAYPDIPGGWRTPDLTRPPPAVIPIRLRTGAFEMALFTTITTLGTPLDVTAQETRIETFFPADDASDRILRSVASDHGLVQGRA